MKTKFFFILLFSLLLLTFTPTHAKNYYVSREIHASDFNDGSIHHPFYSFHKGTSVLKAGDTLFIRKGIYYEQIILKSSGTKENPINISNYKDEKVILSGKQLTASYIESNTGLINIIGKDHIYIHGLEIADYTTKQAGKEAIGIAVSYGSSFITIDNCYIHHIQTLNETTRAVAYGIYVFGNNKDKPINSFVLNNCEISYCKTGFSEAISLNGNIENFKITRCIITIILAFYLPDTTPSTVLINIPI